MIAHISIGMVRGFYAAFIALLAGAPIWICLLTYSVVGCLSILLGPIVVGALARVDFRSTQSGSTAVQHAR